MNALLKRLLGIPGLVTLGMARDATQVVAYTGFTNPDDRDLLKKIDEFLNAR